MANNQETEIFIDVALDGSFKIDVQNGEGGSCTDLTAQIESSLGTVTDRQYKPEHDDRIRNVSVQQQNRIRQ